MRNLLGGLLGTVLGSYILVLILNLSQPAYPQEVTAIWMLLAGSYNLSQSFVALLNPLTVVSYLIVWLAIGLITGLFSKSGWNAARTAVWTGVWICILAITSVLLIDPTFWSDPDRNWSLLLLFASTIVAANLTLLSAYPITRVMKMLRQEKELPIPEGIQTKCECGAVFKSKPMICSECGRILAEE
ncbi:MAG: hypothetical protein ACXADC_17235 [Candidatus Thorarchaeota archaeon]|jgi:hypothetical protein